MNQGVLELNLNHKILYRDLKSLSFYEDLNKKFNNFCFSRDHCLLLKGDELFSSYMAQAFYEKLVDSYKCIFISLRLTDSYEILENLDSFDYIFIDKFNHIFKNDIGEINLFNLYNFSKANNKKIILSEDSSINNMPNLPDLASRLNSNLEIFIPSLTDEDKKNLIKSELKKRGLLINENCLDYIINRSSRNLESLLELVDQLDLLSLERKKNISIPLIKEIIE
jgi:DnaA family protein|tara:strand:- start:12708 stop:13379 length:672 start_codon:yes stop_codon:yes gene_type:complete